MGIVIEVSMRSCSLPVIVVVSDDEIDSTDGENVVDEKQESPNDLPYERVGSIVGEEEEAAWKECAVNVGRRLRRRKAWALGQVAEDGVLDERREGRTE